MSATTYLRQLLRSARAHPKRGLVLDPPPQLDDAEVADWLREIADRVTVSAKPGRRRDAASEARLTEFRRQVALGHDEPSAAAWAARNAVLRKPVSTESVLRAWRRAKAEGRADEIESYANSTRASPTEFDKLAD